MVCEPSVPVSEGGNGWIRNTILERLITSQEAESAGADFLVLLCVGLHLKIRGNGDCQPPLWLM
jgi:hypothetical protein